jgi:uncharacterized protein (TIGR03435 family)
MIPSQLLPFGNHLWQSTLFAAAAGLLTLFLRKNRAPVRYWLWLSASVKFLVPFSILVDIGDLLGQPTASATAKPTLVSATSFSFALEQVGEPFTMPVARPGIHWPYASAIVPVLIAVWAVGFASLVCRWALRWWRMRASMRTASALDLTIGLSVKSSPAFGEPGVFGILRPVLLLPDGIVDCLTAQEMDAIVAHELCHIRRRDNLTTAIHMAVESLFWFHPLMWWLGARLMEEREQACDEEVLRLGGDPHAYAEGILRICELYLASPLACVAGVTGGDLKRRIEAIVSNREVLKLNFGRKVVLAVAALTAVVAPISVGIVNAPFVRAQSRADQTPRFEVVSVKPSDCAGPGGSVELPPGRLYMNCQTLMALITRAYAMYGNARFNPNFLSVRIEGGPGWISSDSDRFEINAKADGTPSLEMMDGPMLQALLEDRFKLKIHRETREVPVYELTVAKGGIKMQRVEDGSCVPVNPAQPLSGTDGKPLCNTGSVGRSGPNGEIQDMDLRAISIGEFLNQLPRFLDQRSVIDKTGLTGRFHIHLEFLRDLTTSDNPAPSIFAAVQQQLGLRLDQAKGPGEFLVIDHVERPTEN